jgi:type I restriction enzyme S subunit
MSSHSFGEIASASRESLSPLQNPEETFDHYSIPAYDEARLPIVEEGSQIKSNKFIVPADSVLLSKLNPRIPRTWLPAVGNQRRSLCSTEFIVLRPREGWSREFVYSLCNSNTFQDAFSGMVTGTSGSHQRVKPEYLGKLPVQFPSRELVAKFTQVIKPAHARVALNLEQNSTLATLRDALLPKLASGEVGIAQQLHATGSGKD